MKSVANVLRSLARGIGIGLVLTASWSLQADTTMPAKLGDTSEGSNSWRFFAGTEFPGATGSLEWKYAEKETVGTIRFDFSGGGAYVAAFSPVTIPAGYRELRLKVRSTQQLKIGLRLTDASNQVHQVLLSYNDVNQWQTLRWDLLEFRSDIHWGGNKDGRLAFPVKTVQILVNRSADLSLTGYVEFKDLELLP